MPKRTAARSGKVKQQPIAVHYPHRLPKAYQIGRQAVVVLWTNKLLFGGITAIYLVLFLFFVQDSSAGASVSSLRTLLSGSSSRFTGSINAFASLVGTSGTSSSGVTSIYRFLLLLTASLAIVWALRQVLGGASKVRIRDAFYQGMYPLVPVLLVFVVIIIQLLPALIGAGLYALVVNNGIASHLIEQILWAVLAIALLVVSCYWIISSVFALYIVSLPDMTPLKALRSARQLVRHRRLRVVRKLLFLPLVILAVTLIIILPVLLTVTAAAAAVLFVLGVLFLPVIHAYMYGLYRELLN